jgi:hypothetical protein
MKVKLPTGKPFRIEEHERFPGLDLECVPGVINLKLREEFDVHLSRIEYRTCVVPSGQYQKQSYAWFCDRGEWMYALHPEQRNAYSPFSWPSWLKAMGDPLRAQIAQLNNHIWWNACLVTYCPPGGGVFDRAGDGDAWVERGTPVVDVIIIPEAAADGWDAVHAKLEIFGGEREIEVDVESGTAFVIRTDAGVEKTPTWKHRYSCLSAFYVVSLVCIHPLSVFRQYQVKYPQRTVAGMACETRLIPAINTPRVAARVPHPYSPEPKVAAEDDVLPLRPEKKKKLRVPHPEPEDVASPAEKTIKKKLRV